MSARWWPKNVDAADVTGRCSPRVGFALSGIVVASDRGQMRMEKGVVYNVQYLYSLCYAYLCIMYKAVVS